MEYYVVGSICLLSTSSAAYICTCIYDRVHTMRERRASSQLVANISVEFFNLAIRAVTSYYSAPAPAPQNMADVMAMYATSVNQEQRSNISLLRVVSNTTVARHTGCTNRCTICLDEMQEGDILRITSCGHSFHLACLETALLRTPTCPLCRHSIDSDEILSGRSTPSSGHEGLDALD